MGEAAPLGGTSEPAPPDDLSGPFELLAEMTQDFASSLDIEKTLELALLRIARHLGAMVGSIWLLESDADELVCRASVGPHSITGLRLSATEGIIGRSVQKNVCQAILDASADPAFSSKADESSGFTTHSLLCAPMSVKDRAIGAIELVNKESASGRFSRADAHMLETLASSAALAITNARMAASVIEHERVRSQLEVAAEVQRNLMPQPRPAPFPLFGVNVPARTVSGDFFDIIPRADGSIAFCLGDVSGKGIEAALLATKTASLYRCLSKSIDGPGPVLARLNAEICETVTRGMFVTMVAGVFDPGSGDVCLANAGHEPTLLHRAAGFESVSAEEPPLGIAPGIVGGRAYPERALNMHGASLYMFSDGLTEACVEDGTELGAEGLQSLIARFSQLPVAERVRAVLANVRALEHRDDLTLLAVSHPGTAA